ncbi:MAG: prolyl oligopeptidase family serine peptidase, partial [Ginsengibacter sp.]
MKRIFLFCACCIICVSLSAQTSHPPITKKQSKVFNEHGNKRTDDYYWLNNPEDSNVINHLKQENAYVTAYMKHTESLQKKLYNEIVSRIPGKDESLPVQRNGYWYFVRFDEGNQYPFYTRRKGTTTAREEMVLNIPELAKHHQIYLVRGYSVCSDNNLLAYGIDTSGDRRSILYIKNLSEGSLYKDVIDNTSGNFVWANDNKTVYYVLNDHTVRPFKVMRHTLGNSIDTDEEIYTENDSTYSIELAKSKNDKYIFIHSISTNTSEDRFLDPGDANAKPILIQPRTDNVEYSTTYYEGYVFHIYTNKDATNFRLVTAPVDSPSMENWKDVIPANDNVFLENTEVLKNYYLAQTKENGLPQIKIFDRKSNQWKKVNFGEEDYVAEMYMATDNYYSDSIRYFFTSLKTPGSTYFYNLKTGQRKLLKREKVGNYNPALYTTKRVWSTSTDSTKVPVSIVYRTDKFKKDGNNPLLLYAYGSYGYSMDPSFYSAVVSLLDRGISYAIAHIRGGQEMGRNWFEQGRLLHKKNTFTDFVDVAQFLIKEKYTSANKLFANGG